MPRCCERSGTTNARIMQGVAQALGPGPLNQPLAVGDDSFVNQLLQQDLFGRVEIGEFDAVCVRTLLLRSGCLNRLDVADRVSRTELGLAFAGLRNEGKRKVDLLSHLAEPLLRFDQTAEYADVGDRDVAGTGRLTDDGSSDFAGQVNLDPHGLAQRCATDRLRKGKMQAGKRARDVVINGRSE